MEQNMGMAWKRFLVANLVVIVVLFALSCKKKISSSSSNVMISPSQVIQPAKPDQISQPSSAILEQYLIPKDQRVIAKDFELPTLDNKKFQLDSLKGTIVLIDFATT